MELSVSAEPNVAAANTMLDSVQLISRRAHQQPQPCPAHNPSPSPNPQSYGLWSANPGLLTVSANASSSGPPEPSPGELVCLEAFFDLHVEQEEDAQQELKQGAILEW